MPLPILLEHQGMLGRRPPPPNWPGRQPQGWPGQQPGFNLQEATGALDTAQGLLGDASSEITAADMEPLSNARGMVSQAQHVLSRGFGPPRQQNPWGGRQGTMPGILGMLGGIGPQAIAGAPQGGGPLSQPTPKHSGGYPKTPQDLGPQGIAPPMLPAFMANGGPAETTGIGPLYMQGGGDASLTFDAGDAMGLAASVADNLGAFGKLGGITGPIGIGLGVFNAIRSGNLLDAVPFNLGNVLYQKFIESDEAERERTQGPEWGKPSWLTGPQVTRGPLAPAMYPTPGTRPFDPTENPFDPGTSAGEDDYSSGPGAGFGWGGYGAEGGESWDANKGGLATLL